MPGNVEVKAKVKELGEKIKRAEELKSEGPIILKQFDVFFGAQFGCRLKLRMEENVETMESKAVLISYERDNVDGPKFSKYQMTPVQHPESLTDVLHMSNTTVGKVEKTRHVYIIKRNGLSARVHLDDVKYLGSFLEFEVIVKDDSEMEEAHAFAKYLSETFEVRQEDTLAGAYMDLIREIREKEKMAEEAAKKVIDVITIEDD